MNDEEFYKAEEKLKLNAHGFPAILIIGSGVLLLVANLFGLNLTHYLWPGFIIVPGLLLLAPAFTTPSKRRNPLAFLAIPGAIVTTVGVLLFVMNLTNHYEAWAYSWTLIPAAAIAGVMYAMRYDPTNGIHEFGEKFLRISGYVFVALAIIFELLIFNSLGPWFAVVLILYGVFMLVRNRQLQKSI